MRPRVHSREVEEPLAEALPVLGQAALRHAATNLYRFIAACANPAYHMLLIWLWVEDYERFGLPACDPAARRFRISFPDEGPDLVLATEGVAIEVDLDPPTSTRGRHAVTTAATRANARALANQFLGEMENRVQKCRTLRARENRAKQR